MIGIGREAYAMRKNGEVFPIDIAVSEMRIGGDLMFTGIIREITDRKRNEESSRRHEQILEQIHDSVISTNVDSIITSWNKGAERLFGYKKQEAVGRHISFIFPENERETAVEDLNKELFSKGSYEYEARLVNKSGKAFYAQVSLSTLTDPEGAITGVIGYSTDITQRREAEQKLGQAKKAAELFAEELKQSLLVSESLRDDMEDAKQQAEEANRAKSYFLANMSHEIRTPLNAIIGFAEVLSDETFGSLNVKQARQIKHILDSGRHLLSLINDILDFSKIEAGELSLEETFFDLEEVIYLILQEQAPRAQAKGLEITGRINPGAPHRIKGDPLRLRQILVNLIGNAVKFTETGCVAVDVETASKSDGTEMLRVLVTDTGIGIPEDRQDRIFERFTQADEQTTKKFGGTGLGTTISKQLVELMGGTIRLESQPDRGSVFSFQIPLVPEQDKGALPREDPSLLRGLNALVIEPFENTNSIIREIITAYGGAALGVPGSARALAELNRANREKTPFDLILIDSTVTSPKAYDLAGIILDVAQNPAPTIIFLIPSSSRELSLPQGLANHTHFIATPTMAGPFIEAVKTALGMSPTPTAKASINASIKKKRLRILLVEDNPFNQELAIIALEKEGHQVMAVANGLEAVEEFTLGKYDLILMDVEMPVMDGLTAARRIRDMEKDAAARTPMAAMTAYSFFDETRQCLEAGMDMVLSKPMQRPELIKA